MAVRDNYRINYNIDKCISSDTHNGKNVIQIIKSKKHHLIVFFHKVNRQLNFFNICKLRSHKTITF